MLRNLSIIRKGLLVLLVPMVFQSVLLVFLLQSQVKMQAAQQWALHTKDVLLQIDRIVSTTLQVQGALLGYVTTGRKEFADDGERVLGDMPKLTLGLRTLVKDNPAQIARANTIEQHAQERVDWNRMVDAMMRNGETEAAVAAIRTLNGKQMVDALLKEVEAFRETEDALDQVRLAQLRETARWQTRLLAGGVILTLVLGALATMMLSRGLTSRIAILSENSRRLTRGEPLVPLVRGEDEIGELDRNFHEMAETIAEAHRNERSFQATLEKQNQELVTANRDLDHKNRENEMFVYSVSHDLRSPLVNLQGFSKELGMARDDMQKMLEGEMDAEARQRARKVIEQDVSESIRFIQSAVMRLSAIIDALLRLSRAGRVEYRGELVALGPVIARITDAMSNQIALKGVRLKVAELPPAWGDATALEQILANLIGNAVNYLDPKRPGEIEIGEEPNPQGEAAEMQTYFVRDNGLGIPQAYLPKVFTIFQRLHGNIAPGEGIGLALVRRMVERHGGRIWVRSQEGMGTTFFLALPRREKSPLVVAPRKESVRLTAPISIPS